MGRICDYNDACGAKAVSRLRLATAVHGLGGREAGCDGEHFWVLRPSLIKFLA